MKLKNFLKDCDQDLIAIGTDEGKGFMYFGEPDAEKIEEILNEYVAWKMKVLSTLYKDLQGLVFGKPRFIKSDLSDEAYKEKLVERADRFAEYSSRIHKLEKYLKNDRKPLLERKVIECYDKTVDNCMAIIISGEEVGRFMLKDEYDSYISKT